MFTRKTRAPWALLESDVATALVSKIPVWSWPSFLKVRSQAAGQASARSCWEAIPPVTDDSLTTQPNPTKHSWDSYPEGFCHYNLHGPYSPKLRLTLCTLGAGGIMGPPSASSVDMSGMLTQLSAEVSWPHLVYTQTQALASDCWQAEGHRDPMGDPPLCA